MSPITNAILGVLFIGSGAIATMVMYFLRGGEIREKPRPAPDPPAKEADEGEYLAEWARPSDDLETGMAGIHEMAKSGKSIIEPMRTRKPTVGWDDLLFKGAQLARFPLNDDQPVSTRTVIGPRADQPLVIETPVYISHMSFGSLSREVKIALAQGSAAVKSAICSGEGGILEDEFQRAYKYVFEYVPNRYSVTDENLQRVDAIEIKIGQSAKPGMGGHLPGNKVTQEIAKVRNRPVGRDIISPAHFADIHTADDMKRLADSLRERSGGKPIGIKVAAGNLEADLAFALAAGPDFVTIDGRAGATGAAPKVVKDATSVPSLYALGRARRFLDERQAAGVSLIITGGLRISSDFAKAIALGADAVAISTAALMAAGCQQYRICHTGRCPVGITSQDPQLRQRLQVDPSARRVENFLRVCTDELCTFARLTGHADVHDLSPDDLCTTNSEISAHLPVMHVGSPLSSV